MNQHIETENAMSGRLRSESNGSILELDIIDARISGRFAYSGYGKPFVRLLLPNIGVEAAVVADLIDSEILRSTDNSTYSFFFAGDMVRAACWLRSFELLINDSHGYDRYIEQSNRFRDELAHYGSSRKVYGRVGFQGSSWLFANRFAFAEQGLYETPNHNDLPIFGVLVGGFGDADWIDKEGHPTANNVIEKVPYVYRAMAKYGKLIILIDMSNEGQPLFNSWISLLHDGLSQYQIPPRFCVLLQQNRAFELQYSGWLKYKNIQGLRVFCYDYFPRRMVGVLSQQSCHVEVNTQLRAKRFSCLNFTPRPNRTSFVSWLIGRNFDDAGYISFSKFDHFKNLANRPEICDWFPEIDTVRRGLALLEQQVPLSIDLTHESTRTPEYDLGPAHIYENTYVSFVTETEISNGEVLRITEKTIKPLALYHPIIVLGNPHSLAILRDLGFKTFQGFVDEAYDQIDDPAKRVKRIMIEIERLLALELDQLHKAYWDIWPVLSFNAMHARRVLNSKYSTTLEPRLIEQIAGVDYSTRQN